MEVKDHANMSQPESLNDDVRQSTYIENSQSSNNGQQQQRRPTPAPIQDDGLFLPPIHTSPSIITLQPSSINNERTSTRGSTNTLDWLTASASQMSVFSGTYFLSSVDQLEIQQIVELHSLLGRPKNGSQFRVRIPRAETIFLAVENSQDCQRSFFRSSRELILNIMDPSGETAFVMRKPMSWGCVPNFLHKITIEKTELIGSVEQNFTIIGTSMTVYDESRRPICYIEGPNVYSCCMSSETQFQIVSMDRTRQIASLIRHYDNVLVDYSTLLTFTPDIDIKLKGLLLGAAFLLEFLFFEHQRRR